MDILAKLFNVTDQLTRVSNHSGPIGIVQEDGLTYAIGYGYIDLNLDKQKVNRVKKLIIKNGVDTITKIVIEDGKVVDSQSYPSYQSPMIVNDRMIISLRDLDKLGLKVVWNEKERQAEIITD